MAGRAATILKTLKQIKDFADDAEHRAHCHARPLTNIIQPIHDAVVAYKNPKAPVRAMRNVVWFKVGESRYALTYDPHQKKVYLRSGSMVGAKLATFDNSVPTNKIKAAFASL